MHNEIRDNRLSPDNSKTQGSRAIDSTIDLQVPNASQSEYGRLMREAFEEAAGERRPSVVARESTIFARGQLDSRVYLVLDGIVKLVHVSADGKIGVAAIHGCGDLFGELAMGGPVLRDHSAIAMTPSTVIAAPADTLLKACHARGLLPVVISRLTARVIEQQECISHLLTVDCEHRLGRVLLDVARKGGLRDPGGTLRTIPLRQSELAEMVGTSRSRVGEFMKRFTAFGWITPQSDSSVSIDERHLAQFVGTAPTSGLAAQDPAASRKRGARQPTRPSSPAAVVGRFLVRGGEGARALPEARSRDVGLGALAVPSIAYSLQDLGRKRTRQAVPKPATKKR